MRLHHRLARLFGYDLVHIRRNHPTVEAHLGLLFEHLKVNLVFDVGGNCGQYVQLLRDNGYSGHIISFEPVAENVEQLNRLATDDKRWVICPYALGAANEVLEINVAQKSTFSSFLTPNQYAEELFAKKAPVKDVERVQVRRLDDVYEELTGSFEESELRPFLKMDTQGYDLEVLAGAQQCLTKINAFQSELSILPLYEGMPDYIQSLQRFRELGYGLSGLYQVTRDHSTGFLVEVECVMQKLP